MSSGLLQSAQSLLADALALGRTRLALLSTELQEELTRLLLGAIGMAAVLLLAALGVAFGALALVITLGEEHRVLAAASIGAAFLALAGAAAWRMRSLTIARPRLLAGSLAELQRDHDAVMVRSSQQRAHTVDDLQSIAVGLAVPDRALAALRAHPVMAAAGAGAMALVGPRRLLGWLARIFPIYSVLRRL